MIFILVATFIFCILIGMPIALSLGFSSIVTMLVLKMPLISVAQKMATGIDSFLFLAIPLFILTGQLMNTSKITDRIFNFANAVVGRIPGGLGHANILASVIFAGMSGSAIADAGGLGTVEVKAMKENGFDIDFAGAVTAASSVIGPIIPPSIPMVIYGGMAEVSVGKLFLGGVIPGLLMALMLSIFVFFIALKRKYPVRDKMTAREIFNSFVKAIIPLITPVIILGGITGGIFTATEASAIAAFYALVVGVFVYKELGFKNTIETFKDSVINTANVMMIIGCASVFSFILGQLGVAEKIVDFVFSITRNQLIIMLVINLIIFIMGMFMESGAILILMVPILLPLIKMANIDLIYFGVIIVLNLMLGQITPPIGVCLFVVSKVCGITIERLAKATIPFIIPILIVILMCIFFPPIVTWLPSVIMN